FVVLLLTLFALSTRVTLGSSVLLDISRKHLPIIGAFRSSGRFIWPSVYLIYTLTIASVARRAAPLALPVLFIACFIQYFELSPLHMHDAQMRIAPEIEPGAILRDPYWTDAAAGRQHLTFVVPPACGEQPAPYLPFSLLASDHHMTINTGYLARFD